MGPHLSYRSPTDSAGEGEAGIEPCVVRPPCLLDQLHPQFESLIVAVTTDSLNSSIRTPVESGSVGAGHVQLAHQQPPKSARIV